MRRDPFDKVRARARAETAASLLEVMIVTALLSLVLGTSFAALNSVQQANAGADNRLENLTEARFIMTTLTQDLRTATRPTPTASPFVVAGPRTAEFYANLRTTGGPRKVSLSVSSAGTLEEQVVEPSGTAPNYTYTSAPTTRLIGSYVVNGTTAPPLAYFDEAGAQLTGDPLSAADLLRIHSIRIELSVRKATSLNVQPTTVRTTVRLPNVEYNPLQT